MGHAVAQMAYKFQLRGMIEITLFLECIVGNGGYRAGIVLAGRA